MRLKGLQFLVIEDAPDVRDVLTLLLRPEGADAVGVADGQQALRAFSGRHFDVVMSDLGLPDNSGRRADSRNHHPLTVVVITGESQPACRRALEAGAGAAFAKPFDWENVCHVSRRARRRTGRLMFTKGSMKLPFILARRNSHG